MPDFAQCLAFGNLAVGFLVTGGEVRITGLLLIRLGSYSILLLLDTLANLVQTDSGESLTVRLPLTVPPYLAWPKAAENLLRNIDPVRTCGRRKRPIRLKWPRLRQRQQTQASLLCKHIDIVDRTRRLNRGAADVPGCAPSSRKAPGPHPLTVSRHPSARRGRLLCPLQSFLVVYLQVLRLPAPAWSRQQPQSVATGRTLTPPLPRRRARP